MDYYLEHLKDDIELLEELMGEMDYGAFLDSTDALDNAKMQIVWPAIFKGDELMENGKVDLQII